MKRWKSILDATIGIVFILFMIVMMATGAWFLQGGDLRDLKDGCFNANGCE